MHTHALHHAAYLCLLKPLQICAHTAPPKTIANIIFEICAHTAPPKIILNMCTQAAAAFCYQPLAGRVAGVLLHFVELLIGPKCGSIQVRMPVRAVSLCV